MELLDLINDYINTVLEPESFTSFKELLKEKQGNYDDFVASLDIETIQKEITNIENEKSILEQELKKLENRIKISEKRGLEELSKRNYLEAFGYRDIEGKAYNKILKLKQIIFLYNSFLNDLNNRKEKGLDSPKI